MTCNGKGKLEGKPQLKKIHICRPTKLYKKQKKKKGGEAPARGHTPLGVGARSSWRSVQERSALVRSLLFFIFSFFLFFFSCFTYLCYHWKKDQINASYYKHWPLKMDFGVALLTYDDSKPCIAALALSYMAKEVCMCFE